MTRGIKISLLLVLDIVCLSFVDIFILMLRFEFSLSHPQFESYLAVYFHCWIWISAIKVVVFVLAGLYKSLWKYASIDELGRIVIASLIANAFVIAFMTISSNDLPRSVYIVSTIFDIMVLGGIRLSYRLLRNQNNYPIQKMLNLKAFVEFISNQKNNQSKSKRIMLVGAGDAGAALIKELHLHRNQNQCVVVAVDDDIEKLNQRILGVKIAGNRSDILRLCEKYSIDDIVLAMTTASKRDVQSILRECHKTKCKIKIVPPLIDLINEKVSISALRNVRIEDLLGREPVHTNMDEISSYLKDKVVLITGGVGSIGSELFRQIILYNPRRIIVLDTNENGIYEFTQEIKSKFPKLEFEVDLASVRDVVRIEDLFKRYKPHVVFHAAAHKHVPIMEKNPKEAIVNNVLGTKNVMDMAEKYLAEKFVLISTDKAVNPTSVMGATKRIAELLIQERYMHSKTKFTAVRFGNVLNSSGSVIPIFRRQIADGGPITVTHPDICRYFMTIPEAVQLVMQAGAMANGGEIFVLDMGEPVKIMDLAENIIRLSGLEPYEDIEIEITGLRPGEKLYEELLMAEEGIKNTEHDKIYVSHPIPTSKALLELIKEEGSFEYTIYGVKTMTAKEAKAWLKKMVPNYVETPNDHSV